MCRNQRDLRVRNFGSILCFEEGDERGPVFGRERTENSLRVSDSELRWLIRLTQNFHSGSERNPPHNPRDFPLTASAAKGTEFLEGTGRTGA
jgi:hypothetical protein